MKALMACALLLGLAVRALCGESYPELIRHFDYDQEAPLDLLESGIEDRDGVQIHDISYASPKGGRVPAYLVVPAVKGSHAGILFGHWAKDGSPVRNRKEFLDEAIALARAGGRGSSLMHRSRGRNSIPN